MLKVAFDIKFDTGPEWPEFMGCQIIHFFRAACSQFQVKAEIPHLEPYFSGANTQPSITLAFLKP